MDAGTPIPCLQGKFPGFQYRLCRGDTVLRKRLPYYQVFFCTEGNLLSRNQGISIPVQSDTGFLFPVGRHTGITGRHEKFRPVYIGKGFVVRNLGITGGRGSCTRSTDGMHCNGILFLITGEIDMYLASHLRHAVDKAALDGVGKVFYIGGSIVLGINMEVYPHTVPGTFLHGGRDTHAKNVRVLSRRT